MTLRAPTLSECLFTYYPGISTGYSGFTDHHAMRCDLNNWLLKEADDMQFWLAGFGTGFVQAAILFCEEKGDIHSIQKLVVHIGDAKIINSLDWLQRLQLSGIDNGPPSTTNLFHSLEAIFQRMETEGPIRHEYWEKRNETGTHTLDGSEFRGEKLHSAWQLGRGIIISHRGY